MTKVDLVNQLFVFRPSSLSSCLDEHLDLQVILLPRRNLHARGNINAPGFDLGDGVGDILRREATGEEDWKLLGNYASRGPIGSVTGAAVRVRRVSIHQQR